MVEWRKQNCSKLIKEYIEREDGYVFFMEQTAFNGGLGGKIHLLHPQYNCYSLIQHLSYDELCSLRQLKRYYPESVFNEAKEKPIIVHLTNFFLVKNRAWYENTNHIEKDNFIFYKELTPWRGEPLFEDKRSLIRRIIDFFVLKVNRKFVLSLARYAYNRLRIKRIKRIKKKFERK